MAAAAHDLVEMLDSACCECFNAGALLRRDPFVATSAGALAAECRDDAGLRLESDVDEGARVGSCTEKDTQTLGVDSPQRASLLRRGTCHPQIPAAGQGVVHLNQGACGQRPRLGQGTQRSRATRATWQPLAAPPLSAKALRARRGT